jgi:large subunit ribosomal protein L1
MKKISKRKQAINNKIEDKLYSPTEAINLLKDTATAKFIESVEAHINLNIDPKYSDQQLRTTLILPKGTGKTKRIAVLVPADKVLPEYQELADVVGSDDLIDLMNQGNLDFDILISTPEMMPKLAKLGRVLGPKGLMPSPKAGTVTTDITSALNEFKGGKIEYRADKTGIVHLIFGKVDFTIEDLMENLTSVFNSIEQNKPSGAKGKFFNSFTICSTMGPAIQVNWLDFKP